MTPRGTALWAGPQSGDAGSMRRWVIAALTCALVSGCIIDRGAIGGSPDAYAAPGMDAASPDANEDAWLDPAIDAFEEPPDAWAPDAWGADAWALDAWTPPVPDAWAPSMPDAVTPDAFTPMCTGPRCEGNALVQCDGARTPCVVCGTTAGLTTPHCLALVPSNIPAGFTFPAVALATDIVVRAELTWNTSSCDRDRMPVGDGTMRADMMMFSHPDQPGPAGEVCVFAARSFTFEGAANVHVIGTRPLILLASDRIEVAAGAIVSVASVNTAAPVGCTLLRTGAAAGTGGNLGLDGRTNDSGGGGGGFCGAGGVGGDGGSAAGGGPGGATPSAMMVPLVGGASGGAGAGGSGNFGGPGGGAIQLSAPTVSVHGTLQAFGAGGGGGGAMHAGGAGGSGGGVHIEALFLDVLGGAIDVRGGAGGGGGCSGAGQCGLQDAAPANMRGGAADDACAGDGGNGAAMAAIDGEAGGSADFNGGGGGGGAGCVVVRQYLAGGTVTTFPAGSAVLHSAAPSVR